MNRLFLFTMYIKLLFLILMTPIQLLRTSQNPSGYFKSLSMAVKLYRLHWRINRHWIKFCKGQFVATADGENLDRTGTLYGYERLQGENDERYRTRLRKLLQPAEH